MSNEIVSVMIDQREPDWVQALTFGDAPIGITLLDAGDLWVVTSDLKCLVVERKTPTDFLNSIADGRLFEQAASMLKISPWSYLIISGVIDTDKLGHATTEYRTSGWNFNGVQGALLTVQEMGIAIVTCQGDLDFGDCITRLAHRERGPVRIHPQRPPQILSPGEALLAALPGIGWEKVQALLAHCGTPAWALCYLTRLGEAGVPGIGDGTKRSIRKTLELEEGMELWPIQP